MFHKISNSDSLTCQNQNQIQFFRFSLFLPLVAAVGYLRNWLAGGEYGYRGWCQSLVGVSPWWGLCVGYLSGPLTQNVSTPQSVKLVYVGTLSWDVDLDGFGASVCSLAL